MGQPPLRGVVALSPTELAVVQEIHGTWYLLYPEPYERHGSWPRGWAPGACDPVISMTHLIVAAEKLMGQQSAWRSTQAGC